MKSSYFTPTFCLKIVYLSFFLLNSPFCYAQTAEKPAANITKIISDNKDTAEKKDTDNTKKVAKDIQKEAVIKQKDAEVKQKVIEKDVVQKQEVPEEVKSAVKKSVSEGEAMPEEVSDAISSTLERETKKKADADKTPTADADVISEEAAVDEAADDEGAASEDDDNDADVGISEGSNSVSSQLEDVSSTRDKGIIESYVYDIKKHPLLYGWYTLNSKLNNKLGLNLGLAYTTLHQVATDKIKDDQYAGSGDFDFFGTWVLWGKDSIYKGTLGFASELRNRFTSTPPAHLNENIGSVLRTTNSFNSQSFSLTQIWLEQQVKNSRTGFRIGKMDMTDYFHNYKFNSANHHFLNRAFTGDPAVAFPGSGGALVIGNRPSPKLYMVWAVADANGKKTNLDDTFVFNSSEYFKAAEIGFRPKLKDLDRGKYSVMYWHKDKQDKKDIPKGHGVAVTFQQPITKKTTPFVRYSYADDGGTPAKHMLTAGIGIEKMFDRDGDLFGVGLAWAKPTDKTLNDQYITEIFYRIKINDHFHITPGYQLVIQPPENPDKDVIGVFGLRTRMSF